MTVVEIAAVVVAAGAEVSAESKPPQAVSNMAVTADAAKRPYGNFLETTWEYGFMRNLLNRV